MNAAFDVRGVGSSTWTERAVTYATAPAVGKSIAHSPAALRSGVAVSFDVTSAIRSGLRSFALSNLGSSSTILINSSEATTTSRRPTLILTISTPTPPGPCGASPTSAPATSPIQHVIWIFMENHGYSQVIGSSSAPFVNLLAAQCGIATNYHAITHPSLPNYIAATSGDTQGVTDDAAPADHPLGVPSIFSQVKDAGLTWRSYQESAPANCSLTSADPYAVKHDPAAYYTGIRDDCALWDVPMGTTTGGNFLYDLYAEHAAVLLVRDAGPVQRHARLPDPHRRCVAEGLVREDRRQPGLPRRVDGRVPHVGRGRGRRRQPRPDDRRQPDDAAGDRVNDELQPLLAAEDDRGAARHLRLSSATPATRSTTSMRSAFHL